jgi:6-pyruvoyltetrahydropterin/6-carboxytetrahydropterin synthase
MSTYRVRVAKDYTVFAAAHFVTYNRVETEPLHGHNYRAAVSIEGDLDENHYVFNFVPLKRKLRAITDSLDHHMLLATGNPVIEVKEDGDSYHVSQAGKQYVFPKADVVLLPIPNTTAELLATWISKQLVAWLHENGTGALTALEVEVEEVFGQTATFRHELT